MFDLEPQSTAPSPMISTSPELHTPPRKLILDLRKMPTWFAVSISCLLIYLVFIIWAQVRFGSYRYAPSYLRGSRLQAAPEDQSVGSHRLGETYRTSVTIRNHGTSTATVVGAQADCACIAHEGLPKSIEPGGSVNFTVQIRFGPDAGAWKQSIT